VCYPPALSAWGMTERAKTTRRLAFVLGVVAAFVAALYAGARLQDWRDAEDARFRPSPAPAVLDQVDG
jgi:hypothetical protein